jgi:type VI secretion system secreted protein Hcp
MAVDIFALFTQTAVGPLKAALVGETLDPDYKSKPNVAAIELQSVSLGVENPTTIGSASGGAGAGKAKFNPLMIKHRIGPSSPAFFTVAASGGHFDQVQLDFRKSGGQSGSSSKAYLSITLKMVFITKIEIDHDSGDDAPTEVLTLSYGAMQMQYFQQDKTGAISKESQTGMWNQVTNSPSMDIR